jgi:hypothetical protein
MSRDATREPKDPIDRWISDVVPGRTFVDIGGIGMNSTNERVTFAAQAGAARVAMADIRPFGFHEWVTFDRAMETAGLTTVDRYDQVDITSTTLRDRLPAFDVVHCTGIFYHLPNPVETLRTLDRVVGDRLIINTVTVPERIENEEGRLDFAGNVALFLPGIDARERAILGAHYQRKFGWSINDVAPPLDGQAGAKMPYIADGQFSCWPYWWLMSDACFRSLLRLMRYRIDAEWKWEDHCLACLCSRIK